MSWKPGITASPGRCREMKLHTKLARAAKKYGTETSSAADIKDLPGLTCTLKGGDFTGTGTP